jgi:hypothetical protein
MPLALLRWLVGSGQVLVWGDVQVAWHHGGAAHSMAIASPLRGTQRWQLQPNPSRRRAGPIAVSFSLPLVPHGHWAIQWPSGTTGCSRTNRNSSPTPGWVYAAASECLSTKEAGHLLPVFKRTGGATFVYPPYLDITPHQVPGLYLCVSTFSFLFLSRAHAFAVNGPAATTLEGRLQWQAFVNKQVVASDPGSGTRPPSLVSPMLCCWAALLLIALFNLVV